MDVPMEPIGTKEIYEKAKALSKIAYADMYKAKAGKKKEKGAAIGFMLQQMFGRRVWTLKDLTDEQLNVVITNSERVIERLKRRGKYVEPIAPYEDKQN